MRRGPAVILLTLLLVASAFGAQRALNEGWSRVAQFAPATAHTDKPSVGPPALASRLVLVIADGLRPEDTLILPTLDWLSRQGAFLKLTVPQPGYPYPAAATLLTGAPPTIHGVLLEPTRPLQTDSLPQAAARARLSGAGLGTAGLGRLVSPLFDGKWTNYTSPEGAADEINRLLAPSGPRLVLLQLPHLAQDVRGQRRDQPAFKSLLGELNAQLVRITEQVDLQTTTVMVTGTVVPSILGGYTADDRIPLLMAGAGVKPGYRGEASLLDVAPTAAALLGLSIPLESQGRPLMAALTGAERPAEVIVQHYVATRRAYTDASLRALGSNTATADPPTDVAQADTYVQSLKQQIEDASFRFWKAGLIHRLPWLGGAILLLVIYLIAAWRQPFGGAVLWGMLAYGVTFHVLFFALGGRYSPEMTGLGSLDRSLVMRLGLEVAAAMAFACFVTGSLLARKGFNKTPYLAGSALHMALATSAGLAVPALVALTFVGWEMPLALPAPGYLVWYFLTCFQVLLLGYLAPVWAVLTVKSTRLAAHVWPLREPGDPERNADKVLRLQTLKRSAKRKA